MLGEPERLPPNSALRTRKVKRFIERAADRASMALCVDEGAAWDRLTAALLRKRHLSGDEVHALVEGSQ